MIGRRLRLGLHVRETGTSVVALDRGRVRESFTLDAAEDPATLLKAALEERGIRSRRAWISIPRSWAVVREVELPAAVGDLRQMVSYELERHLPFPVEEAVWDFQELGAAPVGVKRVLVAAVERKTVDRLMKLLGAVGLTAQALDLAPHALSALTRPPASGHVAHLHSTGGEAELSYIRNGRLILSRSFSLPTDEAVESAAVEIRRTLATLRLERLDHLWLSGDGAAQSLAGAPELSALAFRVGPPTWAPGAARLVETLGSDDGGLFPALGILLRGRRRWPRLDLLPEGLRPAQVHWSAVAVASLAGLTVALGISLFLASAWQEQRYLGRLNNEIKRLDPEVRRIEQFLADVERKRKTLESFRRLRASGIHPLPVLQEMTEVIPPDAWLTNLNFDAKGLELTGQAGAASQLIPLLEASKSLERVEFSSPVTKGRDKEQFRLRAAWETGGPASQAPPPSPPAGARR